MSYKRVLFSFLVCAVFLNTKMAEDAQAASDDTLIQVIRGLVGQPDSTSQGSTWSNAEIRMYMYQSLTGIVGEALNVETDKILNGGSEANALPSGFIGLSGPAILLRTNKYVKLIQEVGPDSLSKMKTRPTVANMGHDNHVMFIQGDKLWILPAINSNDSVKISYFIRPSTTIDTSNIAIDVEWEYVLVYGAASICYAELQDWGGYDRMIAERDKKLASIRAIQTLRKKALPND